MNATTTTELVEGINNLWVNNLNNSTEFWFWIAGMVFGIFALALIGGGLKFLFKTMLK